MKIRTLNYQQFKMEKDKILSMVLQWQRDDKFFNISHTRRPKSLLYSSWEETIDDIISFLIQDIPEKEEHRLEKKNFAFFFAEEEDTIQGLAFGNRCSFRHYSTDFFGIQGNYFGIKEMVMAASAMFPRCYVIENKGPQKRIGQALLQGVIKHVRTLKELYPLAVMPHYNNDFAAQFLKKYHFKLGCGSMGHSYTLGVTEYKFIEAQLHNERIAKNPTLVIEEYDPSFRSII